MVGKRGRATSRRFAERPFQKTASMFQGRAVATRECKEFRIVVLCFVTTLVRSFCGLRDLGAIIRVVVLGLREEEDFTCRPRRYLPGLWSGWKIHRSRVLVGHYAGLSGGQDDLSGGGLADSALNTVERRKKRQNYSLGLMNVSWRRTDEDSGTVVILRCVL
jgi:hypothetical protein